MDIRQCRHHALFLPLNFSLSLVPSNYTGRFAIDLVFLACLLCFYAGERFLFFVLGRAYICEDPEGVGKMLKYLSHGRGLDKNEYAIDHVFEEHLLGCLQKLSLRRPLQTVMIEGNCLYFF